MARVNWPLVCSSRSMSKITEASRDHIADENFAFPKERKEPIHDAAHVRNAIARFKQVQGVTDAERDAAWKRIKSAAKKHQVELNEQDWRELGQPLSLWPSRQQGPQNQVIHANWTIRGERGVAWGCADSAVGRRPGGPAACRRGRERVTICRVHPASRRGNSPRPSFWTVAPVNLLLDFQSPLHGPRLAHQQ